MKIAIISDIHLISEADKLEEIRRARSHFALAWPSFKEMISAINSQSPDICIFLGDIVDWCSNENIEFALSLFESLKGELIFTPGNHDFEMYETDGEKIVGPISAELKKQQANEVWRKHNINFNRRLISAGKLGLILVDSSTSSLSEDDINWLESTVTKHEDNIIFTHTPFDIPQMRNEILKIDANKNLEKYVQSKSPGIFERILKGRASFIFTGHLHFPIDLTVDGTQMLTLPLSVKAVGRDYLGMGQSVILDTNTFERSIIRI